MKNTNENWLEILKKTCGTLYENEYDFYDAVMKSQLGVTEKELEVLIEEYSEIQGFDEEIPMEEQENFEKWVLETKGIDLRGNINKLKK